MKIAKKVSFTQIGDTTILLNSGKDKTYHELNQAGSMIWNGVVKEQNVEQIAQSIAAEFEISIEEARSDVEEFLAELKSNNIIEA